jgi:hypothetical protein
MWEVLPICGKSPHTWEVFPCMRSLPTCKKTSQKWGDSPCMRSLHINGINLSRGTEVRSAFMFMKF